MEISKDNIFKTNYTSAFSNMKSDKKRRTSFLNLIKKNKIISFSFIIFIVGTCINFILMYNFIRILETIK